MEVDTATFESFTIGFDGRKVPLGIDGHCFHGRIAIGHSAGLAKSHVISIIV
jgi:hypothetical protein